MLNQIYYQDQEKLEPQRSSQRKLKYQQQLQSVSMKMAQALRNGLIFEAKPKIQKGLEKP